MTSMDDAHRRDYDDKRRIDEARRAIELFLNDSPPRMHRFTRETLENAVEHLREDSQRTVRRWD